MSIEQLVPNIRDWLKEQLTYPYNPFSYEAIKLPAPADYLHIRVQHDDHPCNPFEDWDGMAPIWWKAGRGASGKDNADLENVYQHIEMGDGALFDFLRRNWKAAAAAFGTDPHDTLQFIWDERRDYRRLTTADEIKAKTGELLHYYFFEVCLNEGTSDSEMRDTLQGIYDFFGIPTYRWNSTGYCQGDWAECLAVATPDYLKVIGRTDPIDREDRKTFFAGDVFVFDAWIWGDCYGTWVENPNLDWEEYRFTAYGPIDEMEKSGLLDMMVELLDEAVWEQQQEDQRQLEYEKMT